MSREILLDVYLYVGAAAGALIFVMFALALRNEWQLRAVARAMHLWMCERKSERANDG